MQTLGPQETEKIEAWLDRVELFLMELPATDRAKIILDLNQQILAQTISATDVRIEDLLKKMGEPMHVSNRLRTERGLKARVRTRKAKPVRRFLLFSILPVVI